MPQYQPGFSDGQFEALKSAIEGIGRAGSFDANEVLPAMFNLGISNAAGDLASILGDLVDLGFIRPLPDQPGRPPRWELAE